MVLMLSFFLAPVSPSTSHEEKKEYFGQLPDKLSQFETAVAFNFSITNDEKELEVGRGAGILQHHHCTIDAQCRPGVRFVEEEIARELHPAFVGKLGPYPLHFVLNQGVSLPEE